MRLPSTLNSGVQASTLRTISDEEIALIADRIALKLAAHLAASLDRNQIIEAVRTVLRS
jgi:hypothetical protein